MTPEPKHGDLGLCAICGDVIECVQYAVDTFLGTTEILDEWWSHHNHPTDGHEAVFE